VAAISASISSIGLPAFFADPFYAGAPFTVQNRKPPEKIARSLPIGQSFPAANESRQQASFMVYLF
jgi:hypothetical protein